MVKLNPDITEEKRSFIANGLRSFFKDKTTLLYEKETITSMLKSTGLIFNAFVAIIGAIALTIAFFLLLVATTQNVTDAIWEYGVLRSMGVTKAEGRRIFMYEAYVVVISAAILGISVGILAAMVISAQFYMFLELPVEVFVPWYLLVTMVVVALVTTFLAVLFPVR
jgi:ABC-type antimicrobial peptide transport system permease subunit